MRLHEVDSNGLEISDWLRLKGLAPRTPESETTYAQRQRDVFVLFIGEAIATTESFSFRRRKVVNSSTRFLLCATRGRTRNAFL